MNEAELNHTGTLALDCAYKVHSALGPGLLESSYKACLAFELAKAGLGVNVEVPVPLVYAGQKLAEVGYRVDILVANELILEIKSVEALAPVHRGTTALVFATVWPAFGVRPQLQCSVAA